MRHSSNRRKFLQQTALGTTGLWFIGRQTASGRTLSPNEKLNLGVIGVSGRGGEDLH